MIITPHAGSTFATYNLRPGGGFHTWLEIYSVFTNSFHLRGEFMPLRHRIAGVRMFSVPNMNIRAADTNALDA